MAGNIKGITIEIGGDTTKLEKALKDVNKQGRDLSKQLREIDKSMKFNPKNTELVAQKQRALADAVENTKKKLETLKTAQEQAKQALADGKIGQDEYDALTREIIKTENQLKSLQGELDKTNSKWHQAGEKMQDIGGKMTDVGKTMSKTVTAPIVGIAAASQAAFNEVDSALDTIVTKTGATGDAMVDLEQSFRDVYSTLPATADEVGNAIGEINTQFGLTGEELSKASEQMIKFAQINGADVTNSTIKSKQAIEKFGLSAKDLDMVLDSVTKTAQNTGQSTDKLFDAVIKGSPQLKQLGLDFAQATEMMGRMEQKGIDSSKALSYLTKAQTQWAKEGKSLTQGLQELQDKLAGAKDDTERLAIASEAFGTKGGAFMLEALQNGALNAEDFANAMEEAGGSVSQTFEGTQDPVDKFQVAMNNLKLAGSDLSSSIQSTFAPAIEAVANKLKQFAEWFGKLPEPVKRFIVIIGALVAAIGPVLVIFGTLISSLGTIITFFSAGGAGAGMFGAVIGALSGPIGIAIAAIAAIIAIGVALYKNWDEIKAKSKEVWNGIKSTLTSVWNSLKSTATTVFNAIKTVITTAWNAIKNTTSSVWNGIKGVLTGIWNGLKGLATSAFNSVKTVITSAWNSIKSVTSSVWNGIKGVLTGVWNGIKSSATSTFNGLKSTITNIWNSIKSATTSAWNGIKSAIEKPMNAAKDIVKSAIDKIKSILNVTLSFPKIKLPHFKISGKFSLNPPQVPNFGVQWYDKGGIFNSPSIIGVGEKRPEFVGALDDLKKIVGDVIEEKQGGRNIIIQQMVVRDDTDIKKIAQELYKLEHKNNRGRGLVSV